MKRSNQARGPAAKRVGLTVLTALGVLASAAPSAFASIRIVDDRPGAFKDIKDTGTVYHLFGNASGFFTTTIGNEIFPAGEIVISNNGGIAFNPADPFLSDDPEPIPSERAFGGSKALLPYWSDIGNHVGNIFAAEVGNVLVVQWDKKKFEGFPDASAVTFQLQIPTDIIDGVAAQMLYQAINEGPAFGGANGSVGYQDGIDGTQNSVQFAVGQAFSVTNLSVLTVLVPCPGAGMILLSGCLMLERRRR